MKRIYSVFVLFTTLFFTEEIMINQSFDDSSKSSDPNGLNDQEQNRKHETGGAKESGAPSDVSEEQSSRVEAPGADATESTPGTTEQDQSSSEGPDDEATLWAMFAHLASFAGFTGIPFGNILGPLVIWLIKKDEMDFVNEQGKEALNFQIAMTVYIVSTGFLTIILSFFVIGFLLLPLLFAMILADFVLTVIAAVKSRDGQHYQYPFIFRVVQ